VSAAKSIEDCTRFDSALEVYVDGELDPGHAVDLEAHVRQCGACFERVMLLRAMRTSLKRSSGQCPAVLRARIGAAVAHERARSAARQQQAAEPAAPSMIQKRYVAVFAVAAGVAFAIGISHERSTSKTSEPPPRADAFSVASVESLLDDLVVQHAQPLPPETTNPEDLPRFDPFVGVPVRRPAFQPFQANFKGARVHAMRDRRAALLQYTLAGGHRVTVYLFNSRALPVQNAPVLRPRFVRQRPVYVGRINGYSVAAAEDSGVGYALASDLGDEESTQLVAAAMP
jgi:anti-sigma factor RsiW